jgi:hypothetical protein
MPHRAGHLPTLEGAAVTWQAGQRQPDALAALVDAHDVLVHAADHQVHIVSPLDVKWRFLDEGRGTPAVGLDDPPNRRVARAPVMSVGGGILRLHGRHMDDARLARAEGSRRAV